MLLKKLLFIHSLVFLLEFGKAPEMIYIGGGPKKGGFLPSTPLSPPVTVDQNINGRGRVNGYFHGYMIVQNFRHEFRKVPCTLCSHFMI